MSFETDFAIFTFMGEKATAIQTMSRSKKILQKVLLEKPPNNIRFEDLRSVLLSLGFNERVKGSHHIFSKDGVVEIINIQPNRENNAKTYQLRQIRQVLIAYNLITENENNADENT
jgi:predicted RNA binding protein YcfA (HicA-like mRNA interferase family)